MLCTDSSSTSQTWYFLSLSSLSPPSLLCFAGSIDSWKSKNSKFIIPRESFGQTRFSAEKLDRSTNENICSGFAERSNSIKTVQEGLLAVFWLVGGNVSSCRRKEIQIKIRKLPSDGDEKTERGRNRWKDKTESNGKKKRNRRKERRK